MVDRIRMDKLLDLAWQDPYYQQCLAAVKAAEPAYLRLLEDLPEPRRRAVEDYLSACEEMDHALLTLAWQAAAQNHRQKH